MASNMREHLTTLATLLRRFLGRELPTLGPDWWNQGVLAKLSYQQRAQADEQQWSIDSTTQIATFPPVQHDVKLLDNLGEPCPVPGNNQLHFDDNILIITNNNDTNINKKIFFKK